MELNSKVEITIVNLIKDIFNVNDNDVLYDIYINNVKKLDELKKNELLVSLNNIYNEKVKLQNNLLTKIELISNNLEEFKDKQNINLDFND